MPYWLKFCLNKWITKNCCSFGEKVIGVRLAPKTSRLDHMHSGIRCTKHLPAHRNLYPISRRINSSMKTSILFCMKKMPAFLMVVGLVFAGCSMALADGFYATTNQIGYQGTVWNITDGTGPWATNTPRDGALYVTVNAPQIYSDYSQLLSNWYEHHVSNQNDSFLQIDDPGNVHVTDTSGYWDADLKTFHGQCKRRR